MIPSQYRNYYNYEVENSDGSTSNDIISEEINNSNIFYMNHGEMIKTNRNDIQSNLFCF